MEVVDFSSWVAGWTSLAIVVIFGAFIITNSVSLRRARRKIATRILVSGTRGKSGTVRLVHAALSEAAIPTFAKITGTAASEIFVDSCEVSTKRLGPASCSEMRTSMVRAAQQGAQVGVFECMAVSPKLIELVTKDMVQPEMVIIPTIRLDHLEEEGLSETQIGLSILSALRHAKTIVTAVSQPELIDAFQQLAAEHNIVVHFVTADENTPEIAGHHPTNVALALKVASLLGVNEDEALRGIRASTLEPRAHTFQRIERTDGSELLLVDLGGANDPESAREALKSLGLKRNRIAPVLVNRWERPLRSLTFIAASYGRYGTVGVAGPLTLWANRWVQRENRKLHDHGAHTHFVTLSRHAASDTEALWQWTNNFRKLRKRASRIIVLFENIHDGSADILRKHFDREGTEINQDELRVKHG